MNVIERQQESGSTDVRTTRYRLLDVLGRGSMGVVYRAIDRLTGGRVALKVVRLQDQPQADSGDFRLALAEEFRTLAALRHPNIISVLDYGFDDDHQPFFTMDELPGAVNILAAAQGQPLEAVIGLIGQMLEALAYLHRRGVVHCDLKPDNVLVTPDGQVRLLDFGLALTRERLRENEGDGISGTLEYIAPEVLQGDFPTRASDLYAVGIILYEVLTGQHPFTRANISQLITETLTVLPDTDPIAGHADRATLAPIVARLLNKRPDDRYPDAHSVMTALSAALLRPAPAQSAAIRESFLQAADFVGREKELASLIDALNDALQGRGSAWLIGGESGVGKSRLLEELRTRALVAGALVLAGGAVNAGAQPLYAWRDPVRRLLLSVPVTPLEAGVLADLIPDIAVLTGQPVTPAPLLAGRSHQQRLNQTIATLFRRQRAAAVLLLEDLHWMEDLETLKQVIAAVDDLPLLVAATYRDDERADLPTQLPSMTPMSLKRLSSHETAILSLSILGESSQPAQSSPLIDFLHRETEGNIYFLIEVLRALAEEAGDLNSIRGRTLPSRIVAGGMHTVIRRRLERLADDARPVLRLCAVIGRVVQPDLLQHAFPSFDYPRWLSQCAEAAILEADGINWRFAHDKLRETVLHDLTPDDARRFNRLAAEAMEVVWGADRADIFALADHWDRAGQPEKTVYYARRAGERALAISAYPIAQTLLMRALALMPANSTDPALLSQRAGLLKLIGDLYSRLSDLTTARRHYDESRALALTLDDRTVLAEVLNGLAYICAVEDQFDEAEGLATEALSLAETTLYYRAMGHAYNNLGMVAEGRRDYDAARARYQQALLIDTAEGEKRGMASVLNNLGSIADTQGDYASAREYYIRSQSLCEEIGYLYGVSVILNNLGIVAERLLDDVSALDYYERSAALAHEIGNRRGETTAHLNSVFMLLNLNRAKDAVWALRRSVTLARQLDSVHLWAQLAIAEARLALTLGNHKKAVSALAAALAQVDFDIDFYGLRVQSLLDDVLKIISNAIWDAAQDGADAVPLRDLFAYIRTDVPDASQP